MKKPRVVFSFVEAGLGHIMPMRSIADAFEAKYGDKVEIVRSAFFSETGDEKMIEFERIMCDFVTTQNKSTVFGFLSTFVMSLFGSRIDSWYVMKKHVRGVEKAAIAHVDELNADLMVSTHWSTNYYAIKSKSRPLSAVYCPDAHINPLFAYESDLTFVSMYPGYKKAKKKYKRFNENNLKLVPFCIRKEAFEAPRDKITNRKNLGLDEKRFTVVLAEGGYGLGKMEKICKEVIKRDLPITLIPICGKNEELFNRLIHLEVGKNIDFRPQGFCTRILEYIAAADLFCGKSGNIIAEPTFFGVPSIITKYATDIEKQIGEYYTKYIGCAMRIFNPQKVADKIEEFVHNPSMLEPYTRNTQKNKDNYGAEKTADYIFDLLKTRFPEL